MAQLDYSLSTASGEAASTLSYNSGDGNPNPEAAADEAEQQNLPPAKKKRNQPGMPDPEAEVVVLSPKSLMATNRFVCEICGKGFQRDQNLQLHRRGHNLPWKLRQRGPKETIRKRVYVCPEPSCVHHDPRRALGDLTGIKKHFCRKHGEKKWKCEKCSKKYAVQSDWKAHLKTCGTRQYQCDCGTVFSRRDSFVTHRAFCDALAQESAKVPSFSGGSPSPLPETGRGSSPGTSSVIPSPGLSTSQCSEMQESTIGVTTSSTNCIGGSTTDCNGNENASIVFENSMFAPFSRISQSISQPQTSFASLVTVLPNVDRPTIGSVKPPQGLSLSPLYQFSPDVATSVLQPALSATALLQKAAEMGSSVSTSGSSLLCGFSLSESSQTPSDHPHEQCDVMKQADDDSVPDGLGLGLLSSGDLGVSSPVMGDASGFFGPKPMMLDFLGLGIGLDSSSGSGALPNFLSSIGDPLDMGAFEEGSGFPLQESWDGQGAERKPTKEAIR